VGAEGGYEVVLKDEKCPACAADLQPGDLVCLSCGYDLRAGRAIRTVIDEEWEPDTSLGTRLGAWLAEQVGRPLAAVWRMAAPRARRSAVYRAAAGGLRGLARLWSRLAISAAKAFLAQFCWAGAFLERVSRSGAGTYAGLRQIAGRLFGILAGSLLLFFRLAQAVLRRPVGRACVLAAVGLGGVLLCRWLLFHKDLSRFETVGQVVELRPWRDAVKGCDLWQTFFAWRKGQPAAGSPMVRFRVMRESAADGTLGLFLAAYDGASGQELGYGETRDKAGQEAEAIQRLVRETARQVLAREAASDAALVEELALRLRQARPPEAWEYVSLLGAIGPRGWAALRPLGPFPGAQTEAVRCKVATPEGVAEKEITYYVNSLGMRFVFVPAGSFAMGQAPAAEEPGDASPSHVVEIGSGFFMGACEVTNGQYRRFRPVHASGEFNTLTLNGDDQPAVAVSWGDAAAFCEWLSRKEGLAYRLPTEAEWEYACRAASATRYPWGDEPRPDCCNFADRSSGLYWADNTHDDGHAVTAAVGRLLPNAFGLFDMNGNAAEWCLDWYDAEYYARSATKDPRGPDAGRSRVVRGGSWYVPARRCGSAWRDYQPPERRITSVGFRVVCVPRP